ncbi:MAG: hypothetical protein IJ894_14050 [Bacteroidales bacterium]|nr:hypothetical protein [Bacteroidales bacterium]
MKKILLLIMSIVLTAGVAGAQSRFVKSLFKASGESVEAVVPADCDSIVVEGDLNKDGFKDVVIIATPRNPENMKTRDDGYVYNFNKPVMAVYFGSESGMYTLFKQYLNTIPGAEDEYQSVDIELSINEKGVMRISPSYFNSMGSSDSDASVYVFRFQNGDFYLIGKDTKSFSRYSGESTEVSENYLTHKRQTIISNVFDESVKTKETWTKIPADPLEKLGAKMLE